MSDKRYFAVFSHEYDHGPSGPARSYWDIKFGTADNYTTVLTICLHHRDVGNPEHEAFNISYALNRAFVDGRSDKCSEMRRVLGL